MNVNLLDMPDDPPALADWLERQIVGLRLGELAAELTAVYPPADGQTTAQMTLNDLLGSEKEAILRTGLSATSLETLRRLLRNPRLLFDLQDEVLVSGGPHWRTVPLADDHRRAIDEQATRLRNIIEDETISSANRPAVLKKPEHSVLRRNLWWAAPAAAAALLIGVTIYSRSGKPNWGWAQPGSVAASSTPPAEYRKPSQFLNQLAVEAHQWFDLRPTSRDELDRRLSEMQQGCDVLLAGLAKADPEFLPKKCEAWKKKFDKNRADLAAGVDVTQVQRQADDAINALIKALRERAAQLG